MGLGPRGSVLLTPFSHDLFDAPLPVSTDHMNSSRRPRLPSLEALREPRGEVSWEGGGGQVVFGNQLPGARSEPALTSHPQRSQRLAEGKRLTWGHTDAGQQSRDSAPGGLGVEAHAWSTTSWLRERRGLWGAGGRGRGYCSPDCLLGWQVSFHPTAEQLSREWPWREPSMMGTAVLRLPEDATCCWTGCPRRRRVPCHPRVVLLPIQNWTSCIDVSVNIC